MTQPICDTFTTATQKMRRKLIEDYNGDVVTPRVDIFIANPF